jgi:hypothetical protein
MPGDTVFLIYGQDRKARDELTKFVRAVGLQELSFEEVANRLGTTPFVAEVVLAGLQQAQAIIALFTPDELTTLYEANGEISSHPQGSSRWQARPNVIFEAGVAYGIAREKTIIVTIGSDVELFSDIGGTHILDLTRPDAKNQLLQRLQTAIPSMSRPGPGWEQRAGNFQRVLRRRWDAYDELEDLRLKLDDWSVGRNSAYEVLVKVASTYPDQDWSQSPPAMFMEEVAHRFNVNTTEKIFFVLLCHSFFEFHHPFETWFDGSGTKSKQYFPYIKFSNRGLALMEKLQLLNRG